MCLRLSVTFFFFKLKPTSGRVDWVLDYTRFCLLSFNQYRGTIRDFVF